MNRNDRQKAGLRGKVHILQTHCARPTSMHEVEYSPQGFILRKTYQAPNRPDSISRYYYDAHDRLYEIRSECDGKTTGRTLCAYDASGRLVTKKVQQADGSYWDAERYAYEADGRTTRVILPHPQNGLTFDLPDGDGVEHISGTSAGIVTIMYDSTSKPVELLQHDAEHVLLARITFTYDVQGNLIERLEHPGIVKASKWPIADGLLLEFLDLNLKGERTTYVYDSEGRCIEKSTDDGIFRKTKMTFSYDEFGNNIEEMGTTESRTWELDVLGNKLGESQTDSFQQVIYEYEYDGHANWTRQVSSIRRGRTQAFEPLEVKLRTITYHLQ